MKKTASISFSIIYVLFTIGVAISSHYCMGRISHQDVFSFDNHGCMCDDMMGDDDDCCKDELEVVTIDEDQQNFSYVASVIPKLNILFAFEFNIENEVNLLQQLETSFYHHPPPRQQPLYSLNSEYTFYG